jgi:hypothetical protein
LGVAFCWGKDRVKRLTASAQKIFCSCDGLRRPIDFGSFVDRSSNSIFGREDRDGLRRGLARNPIHLKRIVRPEVSEGSDSSIGKPRRTTQPKRRALAIKSPIQSRQELGKTLAGPAP